MIIFNSYVSLPEGTLIHDTNELPQTWLLLSGETNGTLTTSSRNLRANLSWDTWLRTSSWRFLGLIYIIVEYPIQTYSHVIYG